MSTRIRRSKVVPGRQEVVEHRRCDEQQGDERHPADEFDEQHAQHTHRGHARRSPEREGDADGERERDAGHPDDEGQQETADLIGFHDRKAEPPDEQPAGEERKRGHVPHPVLPTRHPVVEHRDDREDEQHEGQVGPPAFLQGIEPVDEKVHLCLDERPARSPFRHLHLAPALVAGIGHPDRLHERPLHERRNDGDQEPRSEQGENDVEGRGEEILARPADDPGSPHRGRQVRVRAGRVARSRIGGRHA